MHNTTFGLSDLRPQPHKSVHWPTGRYTSFDIFHRVWINPTSQLDTVKYRRLYEAIKDVDVLRKKVTSSMEDSYRLVCTKKRKLLKAYIQLLISSGDMKPELELIIFLESPEFIAKSKSVNQYVALRKKLQEAEARVEALTSEVSFDPGGDELLAP